MDVVLSGGFVQNRKVAAMAEAENKIYTPHTWTHGMGMAAALHMAGAVSNCPFIEYCYDPPYWPYEVRDMMLTEPLVVDKDGYIAVPPEAGPRRGDQPRTHGQVHRAAEVIQSHSHR